MRQRRRKGPLSRLQVPLSSCHYGGLRRAGDHRRHHPRCVVPRFAHPRRAKPNAITASTHLPPFRGHASQPSITEKTRTGSAKHHHPWNPSGRNRENPLPSSRQSRLLRGIKFARDSSLEEWRCSFRSAEQRDREFADSLRWRERDSNPRSPARRGGLRALSSHRTGGCLLSVPAARSHSCAA